MKQLVVAGLMMVLTLLTHSVSASPITQADRLYAGRLHDNLKYLTSALQEFALLTAKPEFKDGQWRKDHDWEVKFSAALLLIHLCSTNRGKLHPTPRYRSANQLYVAALSEYDYVYSHLPLALDRNDELSQLKCDSHLLSGQIYFRQSQRAFGAASAI